ncbi:MAG TPA: luciferase family protein, partial [Longimicrobiales bacterium]|nr:luciferase family protein [Longimicrobiales bacterium]
IDPRDLPPRAGSRPRTSSRNPHMQLDQNASAALVDRLAEQAFALPNVEERLSAVSVPGARALWLPDDLPAGPPEAFMVEREFAHIHPLPDGSLHMALPSSVAAEAVAKGWAEPHPMARLGYVPETVVMVYGPRDTEELEVIMALLRASHHAATHG